MANIAGLAIISLVVIYVRRNGQLSSSVPMGLAVAQGPAAVGLTNSISNTAKLSEGDKAAGMTNTILAAATFPWFQLRPLAVAKSSGSFEWTAEDGKDTNIIRRLAHNELEYQRMVKENSTIYRRQLVYHTDGFQQQAQRAAQAGQSLHQITLPDLDGRELNATITKTDLEGGGNRGILYAKLPDRPDSLVTVAFLNGREAFTVISPPDQIYLQAESREPGELVVKRVDPTTYGGPGD